MIVNIFDLIETTESITDKEPTNVDQSTSSQADDKATPRPTVNYDVNSTIVTDANNRSDGNMWYLWFIAIIPLYILVKVTHLV